MPPPTRQKPTGSENGAPIPKGGILGQAIAVDQLAKSPVKLCLYGPNRSGKTTLACQFPKPLLLLSFEPARSGGAESARKIPGVKLLKFDDHIQSTTNLMGLAKELREGGANYYKTLVVDSATSLQERVLQEILDLPEVPVQLDWGEVSSDHYRARSEKTKNLLRPFLDLDLNTIILAKEKDHNPPKEEKVSKSGKVQPDMKPRFLRGLQSSSFVACDLGGATAGWLMDACDAICRLYIGEETQTKTFNVGGEKKTEEISTGKFTHYLRVGYHPNYAAGVRSADPDLIPEHLSANRPEELYNQLIKVLRG